MQIHFDDRQDAGRRLGDELKGRFDPGDELVVLGLARGGLPVAREVARRLEAPLDVVVVRKLGVPGRSELAFGAIAPDGARVLNDDVVRMADLSKMAIQQVEERRQAELQEKLERYRGEREAVPLEGKHVVVVDDGLATGASMRAALAYVRRTSPASVTVAVPTGARETCEELGQQVELVCLTTPEPFFGVSQAYHSFSQVSDEQVVGILAG